MDTCCKGYGFLLMVFHLQGVMTFSKYYLLTNSIMYLRIALNVNDTPSLAAKIYHL